MRERVYEYWRNIDKATGDSVASKVKGARFFRTAWFTPVLIAYPIIGVLWLWIFNFDWGVINVILRGIGLGSLATACVFRTAEVGPAGASLTPAPGFHSPSGRRLSSPTGQE